MKEPAVLQENWMSESDPAVICAFDYETIQSPTRALLHQAARFLFIKAGQGVITIDGKPFKLVPNTLVAISPWNITQITEIENTIQFVKIIYDYHFLSFAVNGFQMVEKNGQELLTSVAMSPVSYLSQAQAQRIDAVMEALREDLGIASCRMEAPNHLFSQLMVSCKLIELIILQRRYNMETRDPQENLEEHYNQSVLSYIYSHSAQKLTLNRVAEAFFISQSTLAKIISDQTGSSFLALLDDIRVDKAMGYLLYTDMNLNEIAQTVGFVDASHLSKHFVQKMGVSPNVYRKTNRSVETGVARTDSAIAYSIVGYIHVYYQNEDLTADKVAYHFDLSVRKMNQLLLHYAENNFQTLLNIIRVNHACELLSTTNSSVLDIAIQTGYKNIKTFNLNFYKFKSMTPTQYREKITLQKTDGSEICWQD